MILSRSTRNPDKEETEATARAQDRTQLGSHPKVDGDKQNPDSTVTRPTVRPREARQLRLAQHFAQVVAVLMRDPNFRKLPLGDLEWLVLPPLLAGQFQLAHLQKQQQQAGNNKQPGMLVPVAVALWARVSPAIDKSLTEKLDEPARLPPDKWASGSNIWLMAVAGDPRAIPAFLQQLQDTEFKDQEVKLRRRGADGKIAVTKLDQIV